MQPSSRHSDVPGNRPGDESDVRAAHPDTDGEMTDGELHANAPEADWSSLPEPVRERLAVLAADAVGALPNADVPRRLRPVARFAPAKRAKAGATALLTGLGESPRFRAAVVEWLRTHRPDALDTDDADEGRASAAALLLGEPDTGSRLRAVAEHAEESELRSERDAALARARRLETELAEVRDELAEARADVERVRNERWQQLDKLQGRLRSRGTELRRLADEADQARRDAEQARADRSGEAQRLADELAAERERAEAERVRADRAVAEAETARRSAREARDADEVRLGLLLDTLGGAVDGLRRELSVGHTGDRGDRGDPGDRGDRRNRGRGAAAPADTVGSAAAPARSGERVADAESLERVLALPAVHVVVDGYNVTKTGYPDLPLAEQRSRLIGQLGALRARVGAETTVVFDGADVASVPAVNPRGIRVLFSESGVLADDVIRDLVAAEPRGRPVLVVTSDQEVVTAVRRAGAHTAPSAVLLGRLGRT